MQINKQKIKMSVLSMDDIRAQLKHLVLKHPIKDIGISKETARTTKKLLKPGPYSTRPQSRDPLISATDNFSQYAMANLILS
jgi:hypothetical protein